MNIKTCSINSNEGTLCPRMGLLTDTLRATGMTASTKELTLHSGLR